MRVDRLHPARLEHASLELAVVFDVMRATTTAAVLLASGVRELLVVATPADLRRLVDERPQRFLVISELDELGAPPSRGASWDRIDNSPVLAREVSLEGRVPVLVTTNGTRALNAAAGCARVTCVASFVNLTATAQNISLRAPSRVTLLPAGNFSRAETRAEDELCADGLLALLEGRVVDLAALAARSRADERLMGRLARNPSLALDLDLSVAVDTYPIPLEYTSLGEAHGVIRPSPGAGSL